MPPARGLAWAMQVSRPYFTAEGLTSAGPKPESLLKVTRHDVRGPTDPCCLAELKHTCRQAAETSSRDLGVLYDGGGILQCGGDQFTAQRALV